MDSINDVYVEVFPFFGVLITDEVSHMSLNYISFDIDGMMPFCLGDILRANFTTATFAFCSQFLV